MTRKYEQVSCPTCGAGIGEFCISKQTGGDLHTQNKKRRERRANYAHTERMRKYDKGAGAPLDYKGWPIGKSPS